ncbi:MAG: Two-component sensor histidine kinaselike protein [Paenibacillaceae bacterium]|jgi:signal transduction histidine kinase|nr:Two-component sensor histidine kinaselike protein [Paenibacillaceae bacterium]
MRKDKLIPVILVAVMLLCVAAVAVFQAIFPNPAVIDQLAEPKIALADWEFAWGDPDSGPSSNQTGWAERPESDWGTASRLMNPNGRKMSPILWMRTQLPKDIGPKPYILVQGSQLFEVFAADRLVFRHGTIRAGVSHYIGTPPRLVPLPEDAGGKTLSIRFYSSADHIGLMKKPVIASRSQLALELIQKQVVRFVLGCFYVLIGMITIYPYIKLRQLHLFTFSSFAVCFGLYTIIRTFFVYLLWDNPGFWMMAELSALVLSIVFITAFTEQIFGAGYKRITGLLWKSHLWFGAAVMPLVAAHVVEVSSLLFAYQLFMLASIVLVGARVGRVAYSGDKDARIMLFGIFIFSISGTVDILRQMLHISGSFPELAYWGVFFFLMSLIVIIIRRVHIMMYRLSNTEKLSVAGQMAAGVAHEIRNPVTVISGYLQLMRKDSTYHKPMVELMLGEVNRIQLIINEFLFLAKPSDPKFALKSIEPIIMDVLRLFSSQAASANVRITHNLTVQLTQLSCDENQIKQVLINVIKNALEAMEAEGGELGIDAAERGGFMVIKVTDTGCGIADSDMERIGEPFFSTKENGNGLGVMICRRIVENHNGKFTISSYLGVGTTVDIILPLPQTGS